MHLAGVGDSDSGIVLGAQFSSPTNPLFYVRSWFYMNGACASVAGAVDKAYVECLLEQVAAMPVGVKLMLFAFDYCHDDAGHPLLEESAFYIPDDYARDLAAAYPERFEWVASVHPLPARRGRSPGKGRRARGTRRQIAARRPEYRPGFIALRRFLRRACPLAHPFDYL